MRTYAAFSLLALASSTAMAAPASPDISRDVALSSMPNSPDMAGSTDMTTFPSITSGDAEEASEDPLAGTLDSEKLGDLGTSKLAGRSAVPYREYEKWLEQQRQAKLGMSSYSKRDAGASSDEMGNEAATPEVIRTSNGATAPATAGSANVPFTGENKLPEAGDIRDKMPDIPGVERIVMIDGISGSDGVKIDTVDQATKGVTSLKKPGPSRMRHRRRDLRSAMDQLHMDESHNGDAEMPSKAKQLTTLSRKVRRTPKPADDIVLHSNGLLPQLPKSLQNV